MRRRTMIAAALAALPAHLATAPAGGQSWPTRPLRMIVPFPPGGVTDVVARAIAKHMGDDLGQPVIIDNKPGAGGRVGTEAAAKAPADGYTLLLMTSGTHAILPAIDPKLPYDAEADFVPVALLMETPFVLHVHPSVPARNVAEFVALAKAKPGALNYGSAGTGTAHHMFFELFKAAAAIDVTHVPYRGEAPAANELIAGQVQALMLPGGKQYADSGKTRALATTGARRWFIMPDVPGLAEAGFAGAVARGWSGLMVPARTPAEVVTRLNKAANDALASDDVRKLMHEQGYETLGGTPAELSDWIRRDIATWRALVKNAGLKFD